MPSPDSQVPPALRPVQRTAAYAVVTDSADRVLLVRASNRSDLRGRWFLPGGGLRHGEHPRDGVLRELAEETGLDAVLATPRHATADVVDLPHRGVSIHTLRLIYDVAGPEDVTDVDLRPEPDGTSDLARFVSLQDAVRLPLMPFVADLLGLPEPAVLRPEPPDRPEPLGVIGQPPEADDEELVAEHPASVDPASVGEVPVLVQRPAAYAVLVDETSDPAGARRILLARVAGSNGTWTLPGGGIDHGEHPLIALEREVYEETGLRYAVGPLLDIGSRHFVGRAPDGRLEDFHALRLIYAGSVPLDQPPQVTEVDGSTDLAAWIPVPELGRIGAVPTVRESLQTWSAYRDRQPS